MKEKSISAVDPSGPSNLVKQSNFNVLFHGVVGLSLLGLIGAFDPRFFAILINTLSDAYLGVSVFVAATLAGFYLLSNAIKPQFMLRMTNNHLAQVGIASLLGALPGCGGAIIVVTQFVSGKMSFGALVAVLISTMGDAAFLLIAHEPQKAALVYAICLITGCVSGCLLNWLHGLNYLRPKIPPKLADEHQTVPDIPEHLSKWFVYLIIPGVVLGAAAAMQHNTDIWFGGLAQFEPTKWLGFVGAFLSVLIWYSQPLNSWSARFCQAKTIQNVKQTVVAETSFITVWVIMGFLAYEMLVYFMALDLSSLFANLGPLVILMAVLIGLIPGCGPQIVTTTLFVNGAIPFSALLANAISNDGDALFPALAMAPKAAIMATVYSGIPAMILGCVFFGLGW